MFLLCCQTQEVVYWTSYLLYHLLYLLSDLFPGHPVVKSLVVLMVLILPLFSTSQLKYRIFSNSMDTAQKRFTYRSKDHGGVGHIIMIYYYIWMVLTGCSILLQLPCTVTGSYPCHLQHLQSNIIFWWHLLLTISSKYIVRSLRWKNISKKDICVSHWSMWWWDTNKFGKSTFWESPWRKKWPFIAVATEHWLDLEGTSPSLGVVRYRCAWLLVHLNKVSLN